ncbi:MAG: translation initiation factor [Verrucomicrobiota bacterium]
MSRPFPSRSSSSQHSGVRVNGKIRAREVRVVGHDGQQLGVYSLVDAINMARAQGVDLVEVAPNAQPPVCRVVDYGKYRYEQNKKEKESKKHQHANKVKEVQLSPKIELHDFGVKLAHAIDFLCEEMKVKVVLKFRGREMAHKEVGFQQIEKFTREVAPFGHPDNIAKVVGRSITVMFSPLPRNKRAKNPHGEHSGGAHMTDPAHDAKPDEDADGAGAEAHDASPVKGNNVPDGFGTTPLAGIDIQPPE